MRKFNVKMWIAATMICGAVVNFSSCDDPEVMNTLKEMQVKDSLSSADIANLQSLLKQAQDELADLKTKTPSGETSGGSSTPSGVSKSDFDGLSDKLDEVSRSLAGLQGANYGDEIKKLKSQISSINTTVGGLSENFKTLSSNDANINDYFTKLQETLNAMNQAISEIGGSEIEIEIPDGPEVEETDTVEVPEVPSIETPTSGEENGYAYVDLNLPSGMLWATCNVGAKNPWETGTYYAWGETQTKDNFTWQTYKMFVNIDDREIYTFKKYNNAGEYYLNKEDDIATVERQGSWRTPLQKDYQELVENCFWRYEYNYKGTSVAGILCFKAKDEADKGVSGNGFFSGNVKSNETYDVYSDAHLFFPATYYKDENGLYYDEANEGGYSYYWTKGLTIWNNWANVFRFSLYYSEYFAKTDRYIGAVVRPVNDKNVVEE